MPRSVVKSTERYLRASDEFELTDKKQIIMLRPFRKSKQFLLREAKTETRGKTFEFCYKTTKTLHCFDCGIDSRLSAKD